MTTVITALSTAAATLLPGWYSRRKEARKDTIDEWRGVVDQQREDIDGLILEVKELKTKNEVIQQKELECRISFVKLEGEYKTDVAKLKGEVKLLETTVRRLQHLAGDNAPASIMPGLIIADIRGIIRDASPALTPILHYLPTELRGKSVEILIPERHRQVHRDGLAKIQAASNSPWPERSIITEALTKEGDEVPVIITLYGWQTSGGDWLISAEARLRTSTEMMLKGDISSRK